MPKRTIAIVTACLVEDGRPTFLLSEVEATDEQIDQGIHYYFADAELLLAGYHEPFIHFAEDEAPDFLLPAVRQMTSPLGSNQQCGSSVDRVLEARHFRGMKEGQPELPGEASGAWRRCVSGGHLPVGSSPPRCTR